MSHDQLPEGFLVTLLSWTLLFLITEPIIKYCLKKNAYSPLSPLQSKIQKTALCFTHIWIPKAIPLSVT